MNILLHTKVSWILTSLQHFFPADSLNLLYVCVCVRGRRVSVTLRSLFLIPILKDEEGVGIYAKSKHVCTPTCLPHS